MRGKTYIKTNFKNFGWAAEAKFLNPNLMGESSKIPYVNVIPLSYAMFCWKTVLLHTVITLCIQIIIFYYFIFFVCLYFKVITFIKRAWFPIEGILFPPGSWQWLKLKTSLTRSKIRIIFHRSLSYICALFLFYFKLCLINELVDNDANYSTTLKQVTIKYSDWMDM